MSDETPSPPLRLKPRQPPEAGVPPVAAPAAPAEVEEGKLRLRPKLTGAPPAATPAAPVAPVEPVPDSGPPPVERIRLKPMLTVEPEPVAAAEPAEAPPEPETASPVPPPPVPEEGRIKLKIKLPVAAALAAEPAPAGADPDATIPPTTPPSPPPFPMVDAPAPEVEAAEVIVPLPPPPEAPRTGVLRKPRVSAAQLSLMQQKRMWKYALIAVGGVLLAGAVIGGAYMKFTESPPPVRIPPRPRPVPVPEVMIETPLPEKATVPKTEVAAPMGPESTTRVTSTATIELTPGVLATTESVKAVPNASSAFRTFVASTKISGVYQGTPPRAFINGRLVHTGELVDTDLEITFDSVDLTNRSIVFKDASGATVSRRY
jgi:hypothetical protein